MKKIIILLAFPLAFFSCSKNDAVGSQDLSIQATPTIPTGYILPNCVIPVETAIMAGQTTNVGTITVWNDANYVYVYYQFSGNYKTKQTHLFVGACSAIPVNNSGNPRIGQYPYAVNHGTAGVSSYTYAIPRTSLPLGCLCISAHAEVIAPGFSETGWGQGSQINDGGSWAMKFDYCQEDCDDDDR